MSELKEAKGYRLIQNGEYAKGNQIEIAEQISKHEAMVVEIAKYALDTQQHGDEVNVRCIEIATEKGKANVCDVYRYRPPFFRDPKSLFNENV